MKYLLGIVLAAAGAYFFALRQKPVETAPLDAPVAAAASGQSATKPAPKARLAPEGTFYLVERISVMTDSGTFGVDAGTKVTAVKGGTRMRVTDGKNIFEVSSAQVTRDIDLAGRIYSSVLQQRVPPRVGGVPARPAASPRPPQEYAAQAVAAPEDASRRARAVLDLRARLSNLVTKEGRLKKTAEEMRGAYNSNGRTTYNGKHPGLEELAIAEADFQRVSNERISVEKQIAEVQR